MGCWFFGRGLFRGLCLNGLSVDFFWDVMEISDCVSVLGNVRNVGLFRNLVQTIFLRILILYF